MAKSQTKHDTVATAADQALSPSARPPKDNQREIARRAYDLYLARGSEPGHDIDDWLQAERELRPPSRPASH
jgi:DUF2934 family protein